MASNAGDTTRVGFIGLGAMGLGMAGNLLVKSRYLVRGYDVYPPSVQKFVSQGGGDAKSAKDVAENSELLVCMVTNAQQIESVLLNEQDGALQGERASRLGHFTRRLTD